MIESLIEIDKELLLLCNSTHYAWLDNFFWTISARWSNALVIVPLLFLLFRKRNYIDALLIVAGIVLTIVLCDQFASSVCKPLFCRLRPTHDETLAGCVTIVNGYRAGLYGFISSHAANTFGAAMFLLLIFRNRYFTCAILFWAVMVSYSRIYLGVHFPGDILAGAISGVFWGWLVYKLYMFCRGRCIATGKLAAELPYRKKIAVTLFAAYIAVMFAVIAVVSLLMA